MATAAKKKKTTDLPECPYGARCYRKNPQHLAEFSHGSKADTSKDSGKDDVDSGASTSKRKLPTVTDNATVPPCKYGAKCYRKNLMHFAEFSHPTAKVAEVEDDSGNDTDVISDDEDKGKGKGKKAVKTSDILKRGMSLVKSYSKMTEDERKELIKKAFEAKKQLQEELDKTKEEVKAKAQQVDKLQAEAAKGFLLMDGEKEALEGSETKYFEMFPERAYKEGSAAQMHFRLAESQFYRLLGTTNVRLLKVEYVVNPVLAKEFKECREVLKKTRGEDCSYPVLAFHGTLEKNIVPICETGFKLPGQDGHKHRTDTGWYGKGVYFSEFPGYCMGYIQGSSKFLLCQVLPGKVFHCKTLIHGATLQKGHDSHTSPDKKELVIFNKYHILPAYIVHYKTGAVGDFKYADEKKTKVVGTKAGTKVAADSDFDEFLDETKLTEKYRKASSVGKKTKVFLGEKVQFSGKFKCSQKEMIEMAVHHGAAEGTKAVFSFLIASPDEYQIETSKVQTAKKKNIPIVPEMYLYDCIIAGKPGKIDITKYEYPDPYP